MRFINKAGIGRYGLVADNRRAQQQIIFDPIPRVDGIEPSKDVDEVLGNERLDRAGRRDVADCLEKSV
jgi:hypothetical protein